ncbi:predicted protein [Naegleria gruberi]|uniref:Predicted protein n=1 Tax=Naegleria gruberi TaxID=5762 RepID=D2W3V7_NAEGR|nr:uncharacterized protein NAEGRDRAFT_76081 [Naegleria gruberi]EFC36262.1 predicted protein [Naegleria gruberi]|eukprot:XP_002669006.1 predicted protein [Naegleria gruberi strain NEG-M]
MQQVENSSHDSSCLFPDEINGHTMEVMATSDWKLLEQLLIKENSENFDSQSWPKPYLNSHFMIVDSELNLSTKFIEDKVKQVVIHYRMWKNSNNSTAKVLYLLHGFGGNTFSWRMNAEELISKFDLVVAIDLPGFGYSSREIGLKHTRWNRAFWGLQVMRRTLLELETYSKQDCEISCFIMSHSMSCVYSPELIWLVNQEDPEWTRFSLHYLSKDSSKFERFFKITNLVFVSGMYYVQTLPNLLNYSIIQSVSKGMLKLFVGKSSNKWMLKKAYNRNPTDEEVFGYLLPTDLKNSVDCLMDMTIAMKQENDNEELTERHNELLEQLSSYCHVVQVMCLKDTVHSSKDANRLKEMLESNIRKK